VRVLGEGQIAIPGNGAPSSHILKPDSPGRLWGSVHNEAFCLTLARRVGLPAARVTTGLAGERQFLLVERYDRHWQGELLRRLHQEDFCQALGLPPGAKYQHSQHRGQKGSFSRMMDRLREVGGGADIMLLWDMLVFNVLCCNTDAHLKMRIPRKMGIASTASWAAVPRLGQSGRLVHGVRPEPTGQAVSW
jgi:serine/threonine-protein kinase HipA